MSAGIAEVIKTVPHIQLQALIVAAEVLLDGAVYADKRRPLRPLAKVGDGDPTQMQQNLNTYITPNFASTYGYYFQGLQSQPRPIEGKTPQVVSSTADIVIWNPQSGVDGIQAYLQTILASSVRLQDIINISQNLASIFSDRFREEYLVWTPLTKRYHQPDNLVADIYMLTAAVADSNRQIVGIASYCHVAYMLS